jgi:SAM-dependent methyltransferase
MTPDRDWAATFDETFSAPASAVQARIWAQVYGDDYPASLDTHSYTTISELTRIASELALGPKDTLVDLGCGRGGPGLWVAVQSGARLVGIDIAESAVASARSRAVEMGLPDRAEFRTGTFEATSLPDASVDGLMSVDALLFSPDKPSAIREMARVLTPGARLVATTWDYWSQPLGRPPQVADHRPLLEWAGLTVLAYEETDRWRERLKEIDGLLLDAVDELAKEVGVDSSELRRELIEASATNEFMTRRVLIVAERLDS